MLNNDFSDFSLNGFVKNNSNMNNNGNDSINNSDTSINNHNDLNSIDSIIEILAIAIIRLELRKLNNASGFNNNLESDLNDNTIDCKIENICGNKNDI